MKGTGHSGERLAWTLVAMSTSTAPAKQAKIHGWGNRQPLPGSKFPLRRRLMQTPRHGAGNRVPTFQDTRAARIARGDGREAGSRIPLLHE